MPTQTDQDEDAFLISAPLEIRSILRSIERHEALLRMHRPGSPDQSIMTTILAFDPAADRVIIDCSPDPEFNGKLLKADAVVFDTQVDRINIQFVGSELESCTYDGLPALSFPYPEKLRRIQRREFYRVEIPVGEPASCIILLAEGGRPPQKVTVRMKDISAGGVALLDTDNLLPHQSGIIFRDATLALPEVGDVPVKLCVMRIHAFELPNKKEIIELGCSFNDIPKATSTLIQGYIGRLERRLNAKRLGY
ncbi:flagellar brake protein [Alcaligenaceae bacterium]|nr:flagellar brake protein [Alcaligenaceae bacterium]